MRNFKRTLLPALATATVVAALAPAAALAQDHTFKVGVISYQPHSRTDGITGAGLPPGADAEVLSAETLLLTYEYRFRPRLGVEFVLGVPPKVKAKASGTVAFLGEVMSARNVAPTVLLNCHFGQPTDLLQPYAGIGINYTTFTGASSPYGWKVELSDSVGLAAQLGVDVKLGGGWGGFASLGWAQVKSKLVATGANVLQSTIDFRPITWSAGVSRSF